MDRINIQKKVNRIIRRLTEAGFEACAVGGCVRDSLLGRKPQDWDITTSAAPEEVKSVFPHTVDTGIKHGTVTVLEGIGEDREAFEVTTYRIDGEYDDARHPREVTFTPDLKEDLRRRDFTINAMAYSEETGLIDLFGGKEDLERKLIRAVGVPEERFGEDARRIMRAVRFAAQLGYEVEENTAAAAAALAPNLAKISCERIMAELTKLLVSPHPDELRRMSELGITAVFLPEFDHCMETPQNNPHHCYNVGEHILHSLMAVRPDPVLRFAMLFHDIGKPQCHTTDEEGIDHFHGHAEVSAKLADQILRRLKSDNATRREVVALVAAHGADLGETEAELRKSIAQIGPDRFPLLLEVKAADAAAQSDHRREEKEATLARWRAMYEEILARGDCLSLKDLAVKGDDLVAAGVPAGRKIGEILGRMLQDVLETPEHNRKEFLLERHVPKNP